MLQTFDARLPVVEVSIKEAADGLHSSDPDYKPDDGDSQEDLVVVEETLWHHMISPSYLANSKLEEVRVGEGV